MPARSPRVFPASGNSAEPKDALVSTSPFGQVLESPFGISARELFDSMNLVGSARRQVIGGCEVLSLGPAADKTLKELSRFIKKGSSGSGTGSYVIILDNTGDSASALLAKTNPLPGEALLIVQPGKKDQPPSGSVKVGQRLKSALAVQAAADAKATEPGWLDDFQTAFSDSLIESWIQTSELHLRDLDQIGACFQFLHVFALSTAIARSLIDSLPTDFSFQSVEEAWFELLDSQLMGYLRANLSAEPDSPLPDLTDQLLPLLETVLDPVESLLSSMPAVGFSAQTLFDQLRGTFRNSRFLQLIHANQEFKAQLVASTLSSDSISEVIKCNLEAFNKNQQQLGDLVLGGIVVGSTSLIVGTLYQILYDIINTFILIIRYAVRGVVWLYGKAAQQLSRPEVETMLLEADDSVVQGWFPTFDAEQFFTRDAPEIMLQIRTFVSGVVDDFIKNSREYGKMVSGYLTSAAGKTLQFALKAFAEPYDPKAGLGARIYYVARQWFRLGALLGPILVDILLLVCSGGSTGVVSAAAKIGKIDKIGDALRFTRVGVESLEGLAHFKKVASLVPTRLITLIRKLFDQLWNAVGPPVSQTVDWLTKVYQSIPGGIPDSLKNDLPQMVDDWYNRCATLNMFIAIFLMFSGNTSIDDQGKLVGPTTP